jgi:uncharacterized protein YbjQ (UPF0145 family)
MSEIERCPRCDARVREERYCLEYGLVVRSRNVFATIGADLKRFIGGELGGFTQLVRAARVRHRGARPD